MSTDFDKIEEELRSQIYAVLVALAFAQPEDKAELVKRLSIVSGKLHDLIVHGRVPE